MKTIYLLVALTLTTTAFADDGTALNICRIEQSISYDGYTVSYKRPENERGYALYSSFSIALMIRNSYIKRGICKSVNYHSELPRCILKYKYEGIPSITVSFNGSTGNAKFQFNTSSDANSHLEYLIDEDLCQ